jgi:hypothetical protein
VGARLLYGVERSVERVGEVESLRVESSGAGVREAFYTVGAVIARGN